MANRNFRSFKNPFSVLLEIKKKYSFGLISAVSVAAQSKEVACESSPSSAKKHTSCVNKIFNTLPVSSCYLSQGIPGNRGRGRGGGKGSSTRFDCSTPAVALDCREGAK